MNSFQIYSNLLIDIEVLKEQIELNRREQERWWVNGDLFNVVHLDNAASRFDKLSEKIEKLEESLQEKEAAAERIKNQLARYKGIEHKVYYMRYIEGMPLYDIADQLDKSYDYIRTIAAKIKLKKDENHTFFSQTS